MILDSYNLKKSTLVRLNLLVYSPMTQFWTCVYLWSCTVQYKNCQIISNIFSDCFRCSMHHKYWQVNLCVPFGLLDAKSKGTTGSKSLTVKRVQRKISRKFMYVENCKQCIESLKSCDRYFENNLFYA